MHMAVLSFNLSYNIILSAQAMTTEAEKQQLLPIMNRQALRKAVSDVSSEIDKLGKSLETTAKIDEVLEVECDCCGLKEECTQEYILEVKNFYSGRWVCGLCSEAVKEKLMSASITAMEEAVSNHRTFVQEFNYTTRLNPKLSFTCAMRDIAKRSSENRRKIDPSVSKIARSSSCVPRICHDMKQ